MVNQKYNKIKVVGMKYAHGVGKDAVTSNFSIILEAIPYGTGFPIYSHQEAGELFFFQESSLIAPIVHLVG